MEILYHEEKINRPIPIHVKALYIKKMNFFPENFLYRIIDYENQSLYKKMNFFFQNFILWTCTI